MVGKPAALNCSISPRRRLFKTTVFQRKGEWTNPQPESDVGFSVISDTDPPFGARRHCGHNLLVRLMEHGEIVPFYVQAWPCLVVLSWRGVHDHFGADHGWRVWLSLLEYAF